MTDADRIAEGIAQADPEIDDHTARLIASQWHDGQASAFYAFSSSGYCDREDCLRELSRNVERSYSTASPADREALDYLGTYFIARDDAPDSGGHTPCP